MSLYKGVMTTVLSEEFEVNIGVHQGSVLSSLLFEIVISVVMNEILEGRLHEILF